METSKKELKEWELPQAGELWKQLSPGWVFPCVRYIVVLPDHTVWDNPNVAVKYKPAADSDSFEAIMSVLHMNQDNVPYKERILLNTKASCHIRYRDIVMVVDSDRDRRDPKLAHTRLLVNDTCLHEVRVGDLLSFSLQEWHRHFRKVTQRKPR